MSFPFSHIQFSTNCGKHRGKPKSIDFIWIFYLLKNLLVFNNNIIFSLFQNKNIRIRIPEKRLSPDFSPYLFLSPKLFTFYAFPQRCFSRFSPKIERGKVLHKPYKVFRLFFRREIYKADIEKTKTASGFFPLFPIFHEYYNQYC